MEEVLRIEVGFSSLRASFDVLPNADDFFEGNVTGDGRDNRRETSGELLLRAHGVKAACHGCDGGFSPLWFVWSSCWAGLLFVDGLRVFLVVI